MPDMTEIRGLGATVIYPPLNMFDMANMLPPAIASGLVRVP